MPTGSETAPWLARPDWASGRIECARTLTDAIVASLLTLPFAAVAILVPALEWHGPGGRALVLAPGILFGGQVGEP